MEHLTENISVLFDSFRIYLWKSFNWCFTMWVQASSLWKMINNRPFTFYLVLPSKQSESFMFANESIHVMRDSQRQHSIDFISLFGQPVCFTMSGWTANLFQLSVCTVSLFQLSSWTVSLFSILWLDSQCVFLKTRCRGLQSKHRMDIEQLQLLHLIWVSIMEGVIIETRSKFLKNSQQIILFSNSKKLAAKFLVFLILKNSQQIFLYFLFLTDGI